MGLVGAALGIVALLVGAFFFPIPSYSSADAVAVDILVRGVLALFALGLTLGLSYYAGLRVEQDRVRPRPVSQERYGNSSRALRLADRWTAGRILLVVRHDADRISPAASSPDGQFRRQFQ